MLEIKVTIEAPELATAIDHLATVLGTKTAQTSVAASVAANPTPAPATVQAGPAVGTPSNPVPVAPTAVPAPVTPAAPAVPPVASVPLAPPPQYTVDQIMAAGATLMDAGKVNELMNLLHSFGVQAVMDLKQEQLGAFATAMRELGAQI